MTSTRTRLFDPRPGSLGPRPALFAAAFAVAWALLGLGVASACPMCKEAIRTNSTGGGADLASGINYSIYFMVSVPYIVFGALGFTLYRLSLKGRPPEGAGAAAAASATAPPGPGAATDARDGVASGSLLQSPPHVG